MRHAIILLVIGITFLGHNLGWWPNLLPLLKIWWPLILIGLGIASLFGFCRCKQRSRQGEKHV